ncbi:hypothetical protein DEJ27_17105 [Curtobacterium sp. MCPF17_018]|nr:hypothetical protein DEJ27_17105 [Curtobacterium sp. MCPF17_018]
MSEEAGEELVLASDTRDDLVPELAADAKASTALRPQRRVTGKAMNAKQRAAAERSRTVALRRGVTQGPRPSAPAKSAEEFALRALSESTIRAYRSDLRRRRRASTRTST